MENVGFLCGLWANGIDRESKGGRGEEKGVGNGYIYIYTECWAPLDRSSKDVETNRGDSESERARERGEGEKNERVRGEEGGIEEKRARDSSRK